MKLNAFLVVLPLMFRFVAAEKEAVLRGTNDSYHRHLQGLILNFDVCREEVIGKYKTNKVGLLGYLSARARALFPPKTVLMGTCEKMCQEFCDEGEICIDEDDDGFYACTPPPEPNPCDPGYRGDGKNCSDINECLEGTAQCHANAICNNTVGNYTCTCKQGYKGDGKNCSDVNECTERIDACDKNANCTNTVGSYSCTCNPCYVGDGKTCAPMKCGDNAACVQGACRCLAGYGGNPLVKCGKCFKDKMELQSAVDAYLDNGKPGTTVAVLYGWPIGTWCVSQIEDFSHLFENAATFNEDLDGWNTSLAKNMHHTFHGAMAFNGNISTWNVRSVTSMVGMFAYAKAFNSDISGWQTNSLEDCSYMFGSANSFNVDISLWNTANVKSMEGMFYEAVAFNQYISLWNVDKVTDAKWMFSFASSFRQNLCPWGSKIGDPLVEVFKMFESTACPNAADPNPLSVPPGPFCFSCPA